MDTWTLEDAKNQFSQLVREAQRQPQIVTRHGREAVVVLSMDKYRELTRQPADFVQFMQRSPLAKALATGELDLSNTREFPRGVDG